MYAKPMLYAVGTCLFAATLAAASRTGGAPRFQAHTTGVQRITLRGAAEFGRSAGGSGPFVLTLGADSPAGAVVFTRTNGARFRPGVYYLSETEPDGVRALVVTGSPTQPTGAFRARSGTLAITRSRGDLVEGRFDLDAVGFETADPTDESRELGVQGVFIARPGR